jgi:hypothetical protein
MRKTKLTRLGFSHQCQHDSINDKELNGFDGIMLKPLFP